MRNDEKRLVANYDAKVSYYSPGSGAYLFKILAAVDAPTTGDMLDVGCGDGRAYVYAEKHNMLYTGVDASQTRISKARATHGQCLPPRPCFMCSDLYQALPVLNPAYDLIWCCEVLEHLAHPEKVWQQMLRLLSPTGVLAGTCPVNMPHQNHLQVFPTVEDFQACVPGARVRVDAFPTPGGKLREHFIFEYRHPVPVVLQMQAVTAPESSLGIHTNAA